jgi:septation ring formation regulator EzrA
MDVQLPGSWPTIGRYMPNSKYPREAMAGRAAVGENERLRRELERIYRENRNLVRELGRLRDSYEDLTESALIWIQMYEYQLERVNRAGTNGTNRKDSEDSEPGTNGAGPGGQD